MNTNLLRAPPQAVHVVLPNAAPLYIYLDQLIYLSLSIYLSIYLSISIYLYILKYI